MHSYGGSKEFTEAFLSLSPNFYFSFSLGILNVNILKKSFI